MIKQYDYLSFIQTELSSYLNKCVLRVLISLSVNNFSIGCLNPIFKRSILFGKFPI